MALSPLQLNAGAGLLQNQGLAANANLTNAISSYTSTPLIANLLATVSNPGNVLSNATVSTLESLGTGTVPALTDSPPYGNIAVNVTGFTGLVSTNANTYLGNGDLTKFVQAFTAAQTYNSQTNAFIESSGASQTYLSSTFTNMNSMITGGISDITSDTSAFGKDLKNLGNLIDLSNLNNLGSPLALVQQIINISGNLPVLSIAFVAIGIPQEIVLNLDDPTASVADSVQTLMYRAMTQITDESLKQVLEILGVTTVGINTMADLLNPYKIFPNSFQTLKTPTANGFVNIYINNIGGVNSTLSTQLPAYCLRSTA